jgi:hypothetical protein
MKVENQRKTKFVYEIQLSYKNYSHYEKLKIGENQHFIQNSIILNAYSY